MPTQQKPKLATKDMILGATKRRFDIVKVPVLGNVRIRSLTEREKQIYERSNMDDDGEINIENISTAKPRLIALCVVDADGNPVLTDADAALFDDVDGMITQALFNACTKHCGFDKDTIEQLAKNSN